MSKSVIFVNRFFYPDLSATSQVLTELVRELVVRGVSVQVVCSRQMSEDPNIRLAPRDQLYGARVHRLATTHFGRLRLLGRAIDYMTFYISSGVLLTRLVRRGDVLVVKTDPPLLALLALPIATLRGAALVNWQQDVFPEVASRLGMSPLPRWLDAMLRNLRDSVLRSSAMTVVIGSKMREFFLARAIPQSKLCLIENWADGATISPKLSENSEMREKFGLKGRFVTCYSGNLGRAHEYLTLVLAAEALRSDPAYVFLIIGGGANLAGLKQEVERRGLESFRFAPYQAREKLSDSLAAGDVHLASLLPCLEGLIVPSKLYGILAAGRPVIFVGDADGEIARVIAGAECGVTLDIGDFAGLAAALRRLKGDPAAIGLMAGRARHLFEGSYTLPGAVERWMTVLNTFGVIQLPSDQG